MNKLTVTGPLETHSVRFGTSASALTGTQISAVKINGERAILTAEGYLALAPTGTLVIIN